ncbi:NAD(P)/FAD-dependent oxidoreductase [soil metagenome]
MSSVDLIVAGGGPVGLATAIEARLRGLTVAIIEPRASAIDKACGEGLMPGALPALARLGVDPVGFPLRGVSYRARGSRIDHRFVGGEGRGVRRTALHTALSERARELGVQTITGRVDSLVDDGDGVDVGDLRGRYLVGADGLHSSVRRMAGLERSPGRARRFGIRRHFVMEPQSELIEVYWTPDAEAYVTPVGDGVVGVAVLGPQGTRFDAVIEAIPELAERIRGREPASELRGAGPFGQRTSAQSAGRVLLVGDASGYVDAITGEGIRVGLAQARVAIDAIAADDPASYDRAWAAETRQFRLLTSGLVAAARSPLRGVIVPAAVALPRVFGGIVERLAV